MAYIYYFFTLLKGTDDAQSFFGSFFFTKLSFRILFSSASPSLCKKLTSCVMLLRRLAGSSWGAGETTLQTATLALVHSTAEYCTPVWSRSAHTHLIDLSINDALQIVTGCLHPAPADNLPIITGIQPAEIRRNGATLSSARHAMEPGHLLHSALTRAYSGNAWRLKSRHLFVPAAQQLISLSDNNNIRAAQ